MSKEEEFLENICKRFNSLNWHDSQLLNIQILQVDDGRTHNVCFDLKMLTTFQPGNYQWKNAKLIMKECTIIKLDMDLDGKRMCGDAIADAFCTEKSVLKEQIERELKYEKNPLDGYLHFRISLIHPGGEINVFARDFELVFLES